MTIVMEAVEDLRYAGVAPDGSTGFHIPERHVPTGDEIILFRHNTLEASRYLSSHFGLYIHPETMPHQQVEDVQHLKEYMEEFRVLAVGEQRIRNLHAQDRARDRAGDPGGYKAQLDSILRKITSLSIVSDRTLQAQYNGRVTLDIHAQEDRNFASVLFLLSYRKANYAVARALTEASGRLLLPQRLSWGQWDELAGKFDAFYSRLTSPYRDKALRLLPNELRLLAYGHRMRVYAKTPEYFTEIAEQSSDLDRFDRLVDILRGSGKRQVSYETARSIFFQILNLSFLSDEHGAFRQKDPMLRQFEHPIHWSLLFLLRTTEDIGLENAEHLERFIGSLHLKGRAEMGAIPAAMHETFERVVGKRAMRNREEYDRVRERMYDRSNHIG